MTQAQWLRATGANPSRYKPGYYPQGLHGDPLHPVERVSWDECGRLLGWFGFELPTEAQWEYAARAGTSTAWWTGSQKESLQGSVNVADLSARASGADWPDIDDSITDGAVFHAPVGSYRANRFGLHEVLGNVREWCADWYGDYVNPPRAEDGRHETGLRDGRVHRGGDYWSNTERCRSASRLRDLPGLALGNVGVRPARRVARGPESAGIDAR